MGTSGTANQDVHALTQKSIKIFPIASFNLELKLYKCICQGYKKV